MTKYDKAALRLAADDLRAAVNAAIREERERAEHWVADYRRTHPEKAYSPAELNAFQKEFGCSWHDTMMGESPRIKKLKERTPEQVLEERRVAQMRLDEQRYGVAGEAAVEEARQLEANRERRSERVLMAVALLLFFGWPVAAVVAMAVSVTLGLIVLVAVLAWQAIVFVSIMKSGP